jgi:membrane protein implicated in regulation of membrane protease activity
MEWLTDNPALIWLVIGIIFMALEAMTVALLTIWFVGGAVAAMILASFGASTVVQVVGFIIVSVLLLIVARPMIRKRNLATVRTNADRLIGSVGIVTKEGTEFSKGQGRVGGQIWTIQHVNHTNLPVDSRFIVQTIDGVTLIVTDEES